MSYLYVIAHPEGWRKIGRADDPTRRLKQHQHHSGAVLTGEAIFASRRPVEDERRVLSALAGKRIMGEWFSITLDQAVSAISGITGATPEPFPCEHSFAHLRAKGRTESPFMTMPIIDRIRTSLSDRFPEMTRTEVFEYLSDDLTPWVEELRRRDEALGKPKAIHSEKWIEYVKSSMKRTATTRRRNGCQ